MSISEQVELLEFGEGVVIVFVKAAADGLISQLQSRVVDERYPELKLSDGYVFRLAPGLSKIVELCEIVGEY